MYLAIVFVFGSCRFAAMVTRKARTWEDGYDYYVIAERTVTAFLCLFGLAGLTFHIMLQPVDVSAFLAFVAGSLALSCEITYCAVFKVKRHNKHFASIGIPATA
jgi:hypothetical protein